MITNRLEWAAAFLLGEGSFIASKRGDLMYAVIDATQVEKWPLERLHEWFGGSLHGPYVRGDRKPKYQWRMSGASAVSLMKRLRPFMSPKRQAEIDRAISAHDSTPHLGTGIVQRLTTHCPKGHAYNEENTGLHRRGGVIAQRYCRTCSRERDRARRNREVRIA